MEIKLKTKYSGAPFIAFGWMLDIFYVRFAAPSLNPAPDPTPDPTPRLRLLRKASAPEKGFGDTRTVKDVGTRLTMSPLNDADGVYG